MTLFYTLFILAIFVGLAFGLYRLQKKHMKFSTRVFIALGVGILFGLVIQLIFKSDSKVVTDSISWISIVGDGYVKLLQMLVMPLVFVSIVSAFTKMQLSEKLGKISFTVLATLLGTTAIAALIGILMVFLFKLDGATFAQGAQEIARNEVLKTTNDTVANLSIQDHILSLLPQNFFADLAGTRGTSTIAVVIFSAFIGVAYMGVNKKDPETGEFFAKIINALYKIVMRIVTLVLRLTPYGILALMTRVTATSDFQAIKNLSIFVIASYAALILVLVMHAIVLLLNGVSPVQYFKKAFPVLSFAFTSRSSAGALPLNIETQINALGVDEGTANFAGSFGMSIGQNGCAGVYPAMLAMIVAPAAGINVFDPIYILTVIAVVTLSSFGVAGVGGGATFASLIVLGSLNLPIAIVGLVISVEPLIDMGRTAVNVSDSMVAGVVTSKRIGDLNEEILHDDRAVIEANV